MGLEEIVDGITETVIGICKTFRAVLDYRRPGFSWLRPLAKAFIRLRHSDLHPVPFGAINLIADRRLGLYHGAPTVVFIFKDVRGVSCPELDCGIAGQNMVLAAHSMGLGTCWVGFASSLAIGWPRGRPDGMIERPTHPVDWYENGTKTVCC